MSSEMTARRFRALTGKQRREYLVEYAGGQCVLCNYRPERPEDYAVFDFHHRDPALKEFTIVPGRARSLKAQLAEVDKCDLLCSNCHRRHHYHERVRKAGRPIGTGLWRANDGEVLQEYEGSGLSIWKFCQSKAEALGITPHGVYNRVTRAQERLAIQEGKQ